MQPKPAISRTICQGYLGTHAHLYSCVLVKENFFPKPKTFAHEAKYLVADINNLPFTIF